MSLSRFAYHYDEQFRKLLVQFLAVFTGIQVHSGATNELEERLINVQVKSGSSDRVVAAIKSAHTQNSPMRLPIIAGHISNISIDSSLYHGTRTERTTPYFPSGGTFPDDIRTVTQQLPVPYMLDFELTIWSSSQEQEFEILEQILILFDPTLEIHTSDELFDWRRLHTLKLVNQSKDDAIPGTDRRVLRSTLSFQSPIHLAVPAQVRDNIIKEIRLRVGAVANIFPVEDALSQLDQDGIEYDTIAKLSDLTLK